jgi:hypothetical protein
VIVVLVVVLAIDRVVVAVEVSMLVDCPIHRAAQCGQPSHHCQSDVLTLNMVRGVENGLFARQNGA